MRGRLVRLGQAIDEILHRHAYPEPVANLLGEACALAALVGSNLKFDGRLIVQAQGDGPVRYVVADYDTSGGLRGYCRFDADEVAEACQRLRAAGRQDPAGRGRLHHDRRPGPGHGPLPGRHRRSRARPWPCAPSTISPSPNRPRPACGWPSARPTTATAALARRRHPDPEHRRATTRAARPTRPGTRTQALFETLGEDELIDPTISPRPLLFRLFHEDGVRVFEPKPLRAFCRCSQERIISVLRSFPSEEREDMVEDDGKIRVTCEYCSRVYEIEPEAVEDVVSDLSILSLWERGTAPQAWWRG